MNVSNSWSKKKKWKCQGNVFNFKNSQQKQPPREVSRKRCSKNMQQIYKKTPMLKCEINKVAKQLYWNHTSAWEFSCKFAAYFQNIFSWKHLWVAASVARIFANAYLTLGYFKDERVWIRSLFPPHFSRKSSLLFVNRKIAILCEVKEHEKLMENEILKKSTKKHCDASSFNNLKMSLSKFLQPANWLCKEVNEFMRKIYFREQDCVVASESRLAHSNKQQLWNEGNSNCTNK